MTECGEDDDFNCCEMDVGELEALIQHRHTTFFSPEVDDYWKFEFTVIFHFSTSLFEYRVKVYTGGTADDIYRYNPFSSDPHEHINLITHVLQAERRLLTPPS